MVIALKSVIPKRLYTTNFTFLNKGQVKILTGIRRCGKSTDVKLLKEELFNTGVSEAQILLINLESFSFSQLTSRVRIQTLKSL